MRTVPAELSGDHESWWRCSLLVVAACSSSGDDDDAAAETKPADTAPPSTEPASTVSATVDTSSPATSAPSAVSDVAADLSGALGLAIGTGNFVEPEPECFDDAYERSRSPLGARFSPWRRIP